MMPDNSVEGAKHKEQEAEMSQIENSSNFSSSNGADTEIEVEYIGEIQCPLGIASRSFHDGTSSPPPGLNDGSVPLQHFAAARAESLTPEAWGEYERSGYMPKWVLRLLTVPEAAIDTNDNDQDENPVSPDAG